MMCYRTAVSPRDALHFQRSVKFDVRLKDGGEGIAPDGRGALTRRGFNFWIVVDHSLPFATA